MTNEGIGGMNKGGIKIVFLQVEKKGNVF